jgi:4a-hydroxytetrahydrobiopterin dehydratase
MEWTRTAGRLERLFTFADFAEAFAFMTSVALLAEARQHHPDMSVRWNVVTLSLTSHDAGNTVTERDQALAEAIDALVAT